MSEKILSRSVFCIKNFDNKVTIKGYDKTLLEEGLCSYCLLKTLKKSETISIEEMKSEERCSCRLKFPPMISIKLDVQKNKSITIV